MPGLVPGIQYTLRQMASRVDCRNKSGNDAWGWGNPGKRPAGLYTAPSGGLPGTRSPSIVAMTSPLSRAGHWFYGQAYLLLSLNMLFWAGNTVLGRFMAGHFPPVAMAWCRWTLAAAILLPFAWPHLRRDLPELRRGLPILAALSLTGIAAYNTMVYYGLQYTSALNGSLLQSTAPLLIGVWTFLLFGDRLTGRQVAGIVLSLVGVVVIITRADPDLLMHLELNRGNVLDRRGAGELRPLFRAPAPAPRGALAEPDLRDVRPG